MSTTAIAASPFLKLLGSGLQRASDTLFRKFLRLRKIDSILKGDAIRNPLIAKAVEDFETVLGGYRGEFDTQIDQFLRSLERSGLIEAITQSALLRRPLDTNRSLFLTEFSIFIREHPKSPEELYFQLYKSFEITLREITKDPVLSDLVVAAADSINGRLDLIENLIVGKQPAIMCDAEQRRDAILKIARGLQLTYREVRIETVRSGAKLVPLDAIYIPPQLIAKDTDRTKIRRLLRSHKTHDRERGVEPSIDDLLSSNHDLSLLSTIYSSNFPEFRNSFRRAVVLGDPGGGKSTLCQKICYDLTKNYVAAIQTDGEIPKVPAQTQKLALRIILRKFEQSRLKTPQLDFLSYIVNDLVNVSSLRTDEIEDVIRDLLLKGHVVLAFDGLDEILDTSKRREFVELVELFSNQHPLCPVLVTSRVVGYEDAALSNDYEKLILSQLETGQVREYVKKFLQVVAAKSAKEADTEARRFITQTDENASDLRRNPLLLGLMAFLFQAKGDVPANRPEIYGDCATLMFDRWDKNRGISPDVPSDFERAELFSEIAYRMFPKVELRAGVSRDWLLANVLDFFQNLYLDKAKSVTSARAITDFLVGRAWVMSEVGDQIFAFTHQTFLEYYFARRLEGDFDSVSTLLKELHPRIIKSEWDVVSHLSLQLKVQGSLRKQDEALRWLSDRIGKYQTDKYDLSYRLFAARSLEYLNGSEEAVKILVSKLSNFNSMDNKFKEKLGFLIKAISSSNHRRDLVRAQVADFLSDLLIGDGKALDNRVCRLVGPPAYSQYASREHPLVPRDVAEVVRVSVRDIICRNIERDPIAMAAAFQWYGVFSAPALKSFGLNAFDNALISDPFRSGVAWLVLAATDSYGEFFRSSDVSLADQRDFVRLISKLPPDIISGSEPGQRRHMGAPLEIWRIAFDEFRDDRDLQIGAVLIFSSLWKITLVDGKVHIPQESHISKTARNRFSRQLGQILDWATDEQREYILSKKSTSH